MQSASALFVRFRFCAICFSDSPSGGSACVRAGAKRAAKEVPEKRDLKKYPKKRGRAMGGQGMRESVKKRGGAENGVPKKRTAALK